MIERRQGTEKRGNPGGRALPLAGALLFLLVLSGPALAADRYWVPGGTGSWNSTSNWSATDGVSMRGSGLF